MPALSPEEIDALLPQTQCGLCGYGGCMPYAKALLFDKAPIHLCPPGGVETLRSLGELLEQDPTPYVADMQQKTKPLTVAVIRESDCIGCTKCIQACPVDAIIGSAKQMHTVLTDVCTGCELCVPPCPVDCIEMLALKDTTYLPSNNVKQKAMLSRQRYQARQTRLANKKNKPSGDSYINTSSLEEKQRFIQEAILRAKAKKERQKIHQQEEK